jgi:hypothetical protein
MRPLILGAVSFTTGTALAAPPVCAPIVLDHADVERILDDSLRDYADAIVARRVTLGPESACYVHIAVTVEVLGMARCELTGCSTPIHEGQAIGLAPFRVQGCEPGYALLGAPSLIPATFGDASASIERHCGQRGWSIDRIRPVGGGTTRRVQIELRYAAMPESPVAR